MKFNYYMSNMQKLLYMVEVLHQRGYGMLRIVPSLSPIGSSWRCSFLCDDTEQKDTLIASNWIQRMFNVNERDIDCKLSDLADLFVIDHIDFLEKCKGQNNIYTGWYKGYAKKFKGWRIALCICRIFFSMRLLGNFQREPNTYASK